MGKINKESNFEQFKKENPDWYLYLSDSQFNLFNSDFDIEVIVRRVIDLYYEGIDEITNSIKKEKEEKGYSDLEIKMLDGVVDVRESAIQYTINKLKKTI